MPDKPRTAKARLKELIDISPDLLCCEGIRACVTKNSGIIFDIYPERRIRDIRPCLHCKTQHEVTNIQMAGRLDGCGLVAAEFIDIDEGVSDAG